MKDIEVAMFDFKHFSPTGKLKTSVSVSVEASKKSVGNADGPWLIRVPSTIQHSHTGVFAVEANIIQRYRNFAKFQYGSGRTVALELTSDRILALLKKSTGYDNAFSITSLDPNNVIHWNHYADFRVWEEDVHEFEGIPLESIKVYDFRTSLKPLEKKGFFQPTWYPKFPRFNVGEIALTRYEPVPVDNVPGIEYGYIRIERIAYQNEIIGMAKLPLVTYTIRRSYKNISLEDWNRFSKIRDFVQLDKEESMAKMASSVQQKIRHQLFDPYYR